MVWIFTFQLQIGGFGLVGAVMELSWFFATTLLVEGFHSSDHGATYSVGHVIQVTTI